MRWMIRRGGRGRLLWGLGRRRGKGGGGAGGGRSSGGEREREGREREGGKDLVSLLVVFGVRLKA